MVDSVTVMSVDYKSIWELWDEDIMQESLLSSTYSHNNQFKSRATSVIF